MTIIPTPAAIEWGRRQAQQAPKWSAEKWQEIAAIFQLVLIDDQADTMTGTQGQDQDQAGRVAA